MRYKILLALLFATAACLGAEEPARISSTIKSVKVYRSGAEVIHHSAANLPQGNSEIIIQGISNQIDINSIRVKSPASVTLMRVEFGTDFLLSPEVSARVKQLRDSSERLQKQAEEISAAINTNNELLEVLKSNREIKGTQNNLSVSELMKLMDYYKLKSAELHSEIQAQKDKLKKIAEAQTRLKRQISEEETKNSGKAGQLHLQLSSATAGKYNFEITYLTPNAYWTPFYDIRVDDIQKPMKIVYRARISQTTGIDWSKVNLSLSSSIPNQYGTAPLLQQWFLTYINPVKAMNASLAQNTIGALQGRAAGMQLSEVVVTGYGTRDSDEPPFKKSEPVYVVNGAIMSAQEFRKLNPAAFKSKETIPGNQATSMYGAQAAAGAIVVTLKDGLEDYVSVTDKELDVSFDISLPYDVPATGKEQTATLQEHLVPSMYKFYSVPRLDRDAFLLAEVSEWEKLNFLPGDANIILEGTYVGKSFIDPTSTLDTFNLTLGKDRRVVIKKEKLVDYSSVKFLGSNKLQKLTYEISLKNNKKDSVQLILKDQYPLSSTKEIEVELTENGGASINNETGVLTWTLKLAPGESRKVRFAYNVKYPKDKLVNL